ncbi:conserved hypothetical protein [Ricinus communis]|uniref:Uncharacterized protein n=1 Tax=Ricinus communis TaxID=3988 RepID=B9RPV8_RICCO|nr:conserved hypothetical protein [Ricinus communis]
MHLKFLGGGRIRTCSLQVMSLMSLPEYPVIRVYTRIEKLKPGSSVNKSISPR